MINNQTLYNYGNNEGIDVNYFIISQEGDYTITEDIYKNMYIIGKNISITVTKGVTLHGCIWLKDVHNVNLHDINILCNEGIHPFTRRNDGKNYYMDVLDKCYLVDDKIRAPILILNSNNIYLNNINIEYYWKDTFSPCIIFGGLIVKSSFTGCSFKHPALTNSPDELPIQINIYAPELQFDIKPRVLI